MNIGLVPDVTPGKSVPSTIMVDAEIDVKPEAAIVSVGAA